MSGIANKIYGFLFENIITEKKHKPIKKQIYNVNFFPKQLSEKNSYSRMSVKENVIGFNLSFFDGLEGLNVVEREYYNSK